MTTLFKIRLLLALGKLLLIADASASCLPTGVTALNLGQDRIENNPYRDSVATYGQSTFHNAVIAIFDDSLPSSVNYGLDIVLISPGSLALVVLFDTSSHVVFTSQAAWLESYKPWKIIELATRVHI